MNNMFKNQRAIGLFIFLSILMIIPTVSAAVPPEIYLIEDEPVVWKQTKLEVESQEETITSFKINVDVITEGLDSTEISYTLTSADQADYESNGLDGSTWSQVMDKDINMKSVELNTSFQGFFNEYDSSGVEIYTLDDEIQFQTINRIYGVLYQAYGWLLLGAYFIGYDWADTTDIKQDAVCTGSGNRLINHDLSLEKSCYNNTENKWRNATFTNKGDIFYCKEANVLFRLDSEIALTATMWNSSTTQYDTDTVTIELTMDILYPSELVNDAPSLEDIPGVQFYMILAMLSIGTMLIIKKKKLL